MPTKNPRINVALEKPIHSQIKRMAQENGLSLAMVTRGPVREALEMHDDAVLVRVADTRVAALACRRNVTHAAVWEQRCPTTSSIAPTSKRRIFQDSTGSFRGESRSPSSRGLGVPCELPGAVETKEGCGRKNGVA
jgi:hypothetical protein